MIIGSSNLTYRLWEGSVYFVETDVATNQNFSNKISNFLTYNNLSGVSDICWSNQDTFLIGTDEGFSKN